MGSASSKGAENDPVAPLSLSIRVYDVRGRRLRHSLVGHGREINDLAVSPADPSILASVSVDLTVRFWSLRSEHQSQPCVLICSGDGHREGLLALSFHQSGRYLLTGGMDHAVKLWQIPDDIGEGAPNDHPPTVHFPHFTTKDVHHNVVDCITWYGDLVLSKAAEECKIVLWLIEGFAAQEVPPFRAPTDSSAYSTTSAFGGSYQRLLQFDTPNTPSFYMRFSLSTSSHILAIGDINGKVMYWSLQDLEGDLTSSMQSNRTDRTDGATSTLDGSHKKAKHKRGGYRKGVARPTGRKDTTVPSD